MYKPENTIEAARANCDMARCRYETSTGGARARAWDDLMHWQAKAAILRADAMESALHVIGYSDRTIDAAMRYQTLARETLKQVQA